MPNASPSTEERSLSILHGIANGNSTNLTILNVRDNKFTQSKHKTNHYKRHTHNNCAKMNYTNAVINGTLDLLAGDGANISTLVSRSDSITTFASAIISDAMYFNSDMDIRKNLAKKLNLTGDEINDFFNKATLEEAKNINRTTTAIGRGTSHPNSTGNDNAAVCEYYCNGLIKDVFTSYRNMHGYISLAVSYSVRIIHFSKPAHACAQCATNPIERTQRDSSH